MTLAVGFVGPCIPALRLFSESFGASRGKTFSESPLLRSLSGSREAAPAVLLFLELLVPGLLNSPPIGAYTSQSRVWLVDNEPCVRRRL